MNGYKSDWLKQYGKTYEQALAVTGMALGTLRNIASVCGKYQMSLRNDISFYHHQIAASLEPEQRQEGLASGEVRQERVGKSQKVCIASCNTGIDVAEVDRWRKLRAIPRNRPPETPPDERSAPRSASMSSVGRGRQGPAEAFDA